MTLKEAQLIKRTALMNIQMEEKRRKDRLKPQPADEICAAKARRGLELVACLNYVSLDLETELADAGMFRHETKHIVRDIQRIVERVHQSAWRMLNDYKDGVGRIYNDRMEIVYNAINDAVLLLPPERSYNIMLAIARVIDNINRFLKPYNWDFYYARELRDIIPKLRRINIEDRQLDCIIEKVLD